MFNSMEGLGVQHTNGTIIAEINKRATGGWPSGVSKEHSAYQKHWLATGKLWANELRSEGLITTAETVEKHIKWFEENS